MKNKLAVFALALVGFLFAATRIQHPFDGWSILAAFCGFWIFVAWGIDG